MDVGTKVDKYLAAINAILDAGGNAGSVNEIVDKLYETIVGQYRPLLKVVPLVRQKLGKDLSPLLIEAYSFFNDLDEDKELTKAKLKKVKFNAQDRKKTFDAYVEVGFTRKEAINFILQDTVKTQLMATKVGECIKNASKQNK